MASQQPQHAGRLRLVGRRHEGVEAGIARLPTDGAVPAPLQPPLPAPLPAPRSAGSFAEALHTAIESSGLSLDRIRSTLAQQGVRVSVTTLSYWRRGRSQPERATSLRAVHLLEELLGLPHTALSALLGPPRPRGRWVTPAACDSLRVEDVWPGEDEIYDLFAELDAPPIGELERLSIHDAIFVDAGRHGSLLRMRQVVRATVSGVARCLVVHKADDEATGCPEINSVRHARLGRVRRRPESGLLVAELLLDRPLSVGDSTVFEYEVEFPPGEPSSTYARRFAVPVREYVLQVHFDPAAVPVHCERFDRDPGEEADRRRQQLWIGASASAHVLATDQVPGQVGIRWEWE